LSDRHGDFTAGYFTRRTVDKVASLELLENWTSTFVSQDRLGQVKTSMELENWPCSFISYTTQLVYKRERVFSTIVLQLLNLEAFVVLQNNRRMKLQEFIGGCLLLQIVPRWVEYQKIELKLKENTKQVVWKSTHTIIFYQRHISSSEYS